MPSKKEYSILIIDDDTTVIEYLSAILEHEDYTVYCADNGKVGLSLFSQHHPDLVITDIVMPEKEGIETIIEIRAISEEVPIIAITGVCYDYLTPAKELGANIIIKKPILPNDILPAINSLLRTNE